MEGVIQVYMIMLLMLLYGVIGSIPVLLYMVTVTYIKKDKAYFRKKIDKFIGAKNGEDINLKQ